LLLIYIYNGDWGLGIGDWGLGLWGVGPRPQPPTPKPQSPIPNPHKIFIYIKFNNIKKINKKFIALK